MNDLQCYTQREKIAVDTILIAHRGNLDQKAISHATGQQTQNLCILRL